MKLEKILENQLIYDGVDESLYETHKVLLPDGNFIEFNLESGKYLNEIENDLGYPIDFPTFFPAIVHVNFASGISKYLNRHGLQTFYLKKNNYLVVFSASETQPGRYKVFIDYVFNIYY